MNYPYSFLNQLASSMQIKPISEVRDFVVFARLGKFQLDRRLIEIDRVDRYLKLYLAFAIEIILSQM
jgi:hypothetical protein